ncbi:P-loop containing nucleoside triphosphate hydrolase protein [Mycena leptocephala]|nr:P-loop containing nucleoside triphosphate hydrolase protein [Mycena leptocephala]
MIVAFRTRPPLLNEAADKFHANPDAKEALVDAEGQTAAVEFCAGITLTSAEPGVFVAHVPGMKWSGPTLAHKTYEADLAFGPDIDNEEVYQRTVVANDMLPLPLSGGVGCILAHTMESIELRIARDLFDQARVVGRRFLLAQGDGTETGDIPQFSITFLELLGKRASDLLESTEEVDVHGNPVRTEFFVREDKVGNVCPSLISSSVRSSAELEELINKALYHRRTTATLRNANSSRSHAMLTITIKNTLLPYADDGQLILVDLAGSERYEDSKDHNKQRMQEARDNNKSLMNLKECVRAKAKMAAEDGFVHIPWRANKLTMLLKPIFDIESRQPSRAIIIANTSPHIQDSVHSTNTLSYASPFKTVPPKPRGPLPYDAEDPRTWDHDKTVEWLTAQFTKRLMKSRQAEWSVKAKKAKPAGKTLRPLEEPAPGELDVGVDIAKICPAGSTGKNLGMLYTTQFVERCLEAQSGEVLTQNEVKSTAVDVIGAPFYLILTAKSRKRNEIMQSQKKLALEAYGPDWGMLVMAAHKKCKEEGKDWENDVYPKALVDMMDKFRAHKTTSEKKELAGRANEKN